MRFEVRTSSVPKGARRLQASFGRPAAAAAATAAAAAAAATATAAAAAAAAASAAAFAVAVAAAALSSGGGCGRPLVSCHLLEVVPNFLGGEHVLGRLHEVRDKPTPRSVPIDEGAHVGSSLAAYFTFWAVACPRIVAVNGDVLRLHLRRYGEI